MYNNLYVSMKANTGKSWYSERKNCTFNWPAAETQAKLTTAI